MKIMILTLMMSLLSTTAFAGKCEIVSKWVNGVTATVEYKSPSGDFSDTLEVDLDYLGESNSFLDILGTGLYKAVASEDGLDYHIKASEVIGTIFIDKVSVKHENCYKECRPSQRMLIKYGINTCD